MATLLELINKKDDTLRNKMTAAGWNKAKSLLVTGTPSATEITYAKNLLSASIPVNIENGVLVLLQDDTTLLDADIQAAVDAVIDKYITLEV